MYTSTLADVYINPPGNKALRTKCRQHVLQKECEHNAGSFMLSFMRGELRSDLFVHIVRHSVSALGADVEQVRPVYDVLSGVELASKTDGLLRLRHDPAPWSLDANSPHSGARDLQLLMF